MVRGARTRWHEAHSELWEGARDDESWRSPVGESRGKNKEERRKENEYLTREIGGHKCADLTSQISGRGVLFGIIPDALGGPKGGVTTWST